MTARGPEGPGGPPPALVIVTVALLAAMITGISLHAQQRGDTSTTNASGANSVAFGRRLFFDTQLSLDRSISCATCHDPAKGFTDGRAVAVGIGGAIGTRNTPSIVNTGDNRSWFWDGRAGTLEEQVLGPIANPREMALPLDELERRIGRPRAEIADALASYLRTLRTSGSRYGVDRPGRNETLTPDERAGFQVFIGRGQCTRCHGGTNLSDSRFHNTGIAWQDGHMVDEGRFAVTHNSRDYGAFKTPALMDVALTAPYMHDGSLATLEQVVDFYVEGGRDNPYLDPSMRPLSLTAIEKAQLVAFMRALTGVVTEGGDEH